MNWLLGEAPASEVPLELNVFALDTLLADVGGRFERGDGFSIATLNLDHVVKLRSQQAFTQAYLKQTYVTADGNPIVWLSRLSGRKVELVPGSDLMAPILELAAEKGVGIALLGSTSKSLETAAQQIEANYSGARVVCKISPEMGFDPTGASALSAIDSLKASGAGVCFLALGAPKQEIFAAFASEHLPQVGFLSIGAGIDFISGQQKRAPKIFRTLALEWLWRLLESPGRMAGRYLSCFAILPRLTVRALRYRLARNSA